MERCSSANPICPVGFNTGYHYPLIESLEYALATNSQKVRTRVCAIGLDGVPLELIKAWAEAGHLPTLKKFMDEGAVGQLASTMPPTSGPSWSTFVTGKNPGKHGIYDFLFRRADDYVFPPVNTTRRDGKAVWKIISDAGKVAGSLNVPIAYPVDKINGPIVSGWMTPYNAKDFFHPPELLAELEVQVGKYHIYPTETFAEERVDKFMRASDELLEGLTQSALYLLDKYDPDFFIVVNFDTDRILHQMWHYLDPTHPWRAHSADHSDKSAPVLQYFQRVDDSIARILARTDEDTLVIILSDHGMGAAHNFVVLNNWLLQSGLLKLKADVPTRAKKWLFDSGFTLRNVHRIANQLGLAKHAEYKLGYFTDALMKFFFLSFRNVDWSQSRAYSFGRHVGAIYINVKGREPQGCVERGAEYERVRDEIIALAKDFRDPRDGRRIIGQVLKREDCWHGAQLDNAPDLVLLPKEPTDIFFGLADFGSNQLMDRVYRYSGMHRSDGLLFMRGPMIRKGYAITGAAIQDLTPTILYAMGLPVARDMDGRPLSEAFTYSFVAEHPITYDDGTSAQQSPALEDYTDEEAKQVEERLRELGYLG